MKWVALILLCANIALWLVVAGPQVVGVSNDSIGRLPRVAALKPPPSAAATVNAADESLVSSNDASPKDAFAGPENAAAVEARTERHCFRLGWFDEEVLATMAVEKLNLEGVTNVAIRELERATSPLYWVLVPPAKTDVEAIERFRDIRRQGIDSYLVTEGAQRNAISLGLFESKTAAERMLVQQNKKNLHATLVLLPRNQLSYALVFEATYVPGSEELGAVAADLAAQFELIEIKRCEGIATAEKNP